MASAETSEIFACAPDEFYKIVTDYEKYPQFLQEVRSCQVLQEEEGRKLVEFNVSMIKSFTYSLWMTESKPQSVSWEFAGGDLFKNMSGAWELEEEAGKTRASYKVDAKSNVFVPRPVAKALVGVNLPGMISAYQKRVSEIYGV